MSFSIASTLEKMNSRDKDFRYMATVDLSTELSKDTFKMDADSEKKLTSMVLKLLEDNSNQVQEVAVKCLGPLSKRVKEPQVQDMVDTLCNHLLADKKGADELRDISSIGLKTVITEIPADQTNLSGLIVKRLTPRLLTGITDYDEKKPDIVGYCLEALNDLLRKYGSQMVTDHEKILRVVQPQLGSKRSASRKKAIGCLEHLAVTIPDILFADLIQSLIKNIEDSGNKAEKLRTYIQAIAAVSRSVGYRLGKFLGQIIPLVLKYCGDKKTDSDDELRENCFQCFESLVYRCPKEITPFLDKIIALCLEYIKYDPNYAEDDAEDMDTEDNEDEEEEEDQQEEDYSDDDDMSWKVRRSSVKCLDVVIQTRTELLPLIYEKIAPVLIGRFKEREENVKLEIFTTFVDLLKQTGFVAKRNPEIAGIVSPLRELVPKVVSGITKQLKEKSIKTRSGAFLLLKELVSVLRGSLTDQFGSLVPGVQFSFGEKNTHANLKIDALSFLRLTFATHPSNVFHPHVKALAPVLYKAARDPYYRIAAEALRANCEFVHVLRSEGSSFDHKPYVQELFTSTLDKLKVQDIDQEVKESAINCMGLVLANFSDSLKSELPAVLQILQDRLTNEITRLTTVKALENIASSPLHPDLSPILSDSIKELSTFLRKANRALRQSSLATLGVIVKNYGSDKKATDLFKPLLSELSSLVSDSDLHLTHLALNLAALIVQVHPASAAIVGTEIVPKTKDLLRSNLLQGSALDSLLVLYSELVKSNSKGFEYDTLLESLLSIAASETSKQVLSNLAKTIAAISTSAKPEQRNAIVTRFIKDLGKGKEDLAKQHLALYSIGEIGRRSDLSNHDSIQSTILSMFESSNEETRQAASFALGNVAVGSLQKYLPQVLAEIKKNPKIKYLLLHSLREIIVRQSATSAGIEALQGYQKDLLPLLYENCENEDEGTRNVVAECLGKLAIVSPKDIVPTLLESTKSQSAFTRSTVVTALKFAISDKPQPLDQLLHPQMNAFLDLLQDKDLNVRRNTLLTLNYASHNKPLLIRDILPNYLPLIYVESKVKPELIRQVDLGPFKHTVDDGLEIRKAAYECMYTLLDTCLDRVNIPAFVTNLVDGLKDNDDIKMLSHLMLIRLSLYAGPALLEGLDQLVEPLRANISTKAKETAVKQEVERNEELVRSALRAIAAITRIPNVESNHKFDEFLRQTVKTGELAEKFAAIKAEGERTATTDPMDLS